MRVLIADDSAFMRQALARAIGQQPGLQVVGRAKNGREAVALAKEHKPDAISLDIEMPEMDGLTALRHIMRESPCAVLMCSSLTTEGSSASLQALRMGAADVIAKENGATLPGGVSFHQEYVRRLTALAEAHIDRQKNQSKTKQNEQPSQVVPPLLSKVGLLAIGSSTGGPPVLEKILLALHSRFPAPVVVAQHMPAVFTASMANRLHNLCALPVIHAEQGTALLPGRIYICPGNQHSHVVRYAGNKLRLKVGSEPASDLYHPSVNALFTSSAEAVGHRMLGIILTGIGDDGCEGSRALRKAGGTLYAQDRASSVVYGMPRAVADAGLTDGILTPDQMVDLLNSMQGVPQAA